MELDLSLIPKTETHLHIEGAIRPDTYVELRRKEEPSYALEQSPWWNPDYRFDSLGHFLDSISPCVIHCADDYRRIAGELFEDLIAQNVVYAEITIASRRVEIGKIAQVIHDAWRETVLDGSLDIGILVGLFRSDGPNVALEMVRQAADAMELGVVGVDLLEHEAANYAGVFKSSYRLARDAGLGLRVHAGEGAGADSIWDAIRSLDVSRIAHGARAVEDPELISYLVEKGITLDICPTSNYRLRVVESLDKHPIRQLFDAGVKVTVSSDDPLFFRSNVSGELALLHGLFDFKKEELLQLAKNAVDAAFLSENKKNDLIRKLTEGHNKSTQPTPNGAPDG